jgi:hypothetical protein
MNKKKGFNKNKTNFNSFLKDYEQNQNKKKEQTSKEDVIASSTLNISNNVKTSNDIIDIDDSPDIATWNKEVTRNKVVSNNTDNKYRITKINPKIPTITTIGLERRIDRDDDNKKDRLIDPANQQEIDGTYHASNKLTDQASFFHNKRKLKKSKGSQ